MSRDPAELKAAAGEVAFERLNAGASEYYGGDFGLACGAVLGTVIAGCPEIVLHVLDELDRRGWPVAEGLDGP